MRLPYIPDPPEFTNEEDKAIVERVKQRRGDKGLFLLDRTLLHAPAIADGWNSFLGAIRTKTTLSAGIRETAICRVAVLNKAWYEWESHVPILRSADDMIQSHISSIFDSPPHQVNEGVLNEAYEAVIRYTDAMTLNVQVEDEVFGRLKEYFNEKEIVEITATIAAYNCVSRFLVALDVGERNKQTGPIEGAKE